MSGVDIYTPLYRWAGENRQGEDFTTDAFVFLVSVLLERENAIGIRFLGWLCFGEEVAFGKSTPRIGTQLHTAEGRPDIYVEAPGVFVLIEVKKGSDLHSDQLSQYDRVLRERKRTDPALTTNLVLLTAFQPTLSDSEPPHRSIRWSEVATWLEHQLPKMSDVVVAWLIRQFLAFLRRQVMTIEKVDWQYVEGTKALLNLTTMIARALEQAQLQGSKGSASNYAGFYVRGGFWIGVFFDRPEILRFQFESAKPDPQKISLESAWQEIDGRLAVLLDLSMEDVHFFALSKESQLKRITDFVKVANESAFRCVLAMPAA